MLASGQRHSFGLVLIPHTCSQTAPHPPHPAALGSSVVLLRQGHSYPCRATVVPRESEVQAPEGKVNSSWVRRHASWGRRGPAGELRGLPLTPRPAASLPVLGECGACGTLRAALGQESLAFLPQAQLREARQPVLAAALLPRWWGDGAGKLHLLGLSRGGLAGVQFVLRALCLSCS